MRKEDQEFLGPLSQCSPDGDYSTTVVSVRATTNTWKETKNVDNKSSHHWNRCGHFGHWAIDSAPDSILCKFGSHSTALRDSNRTSKTIKITTGLLPITQLDRAINARVPPNNLDSAAGTSSPSGTIQFNIATRGLFTVHNTTPMQCGYHDSEVTGRETYESR